MIRQKGMTTLIMTMLVLAIATIVTFFTARVIATDEKIFSNVKSAADALNAAQAGFDYALGYLNSNVGTVVTNLSYCASASTTYALPGTFTLSNGATYAMTYGCTAAGSRNILSITAVGTMPNQGATRTVRALVKVVGGDFADYPVIGRVDDSNDFSVDVRGSADIINNLTQSVDTVAGGNTVRLRTSNVSTTSATGAPYICQGNLTIPPQPGTNCRDIYFSNTTLSGMSVSQFQTNFIGRLVTDFQNIGTISIPVYDVNCSGASGGESTFRSNTTFSANSCTCTLQPAGTNCASSTIAGITGSVIYINMGSRRLTLSTNNSFPIFTIGSAVSPVILAVNSTNTNTNAFLIQTGGGDTFTLYGNIYTNAWQLRLEQGGSGAQTTVNGMVFTTGWGRVLLGSTVNGALIAGQADLEDASIVSYNQVNIQNTLGAYLGKYSVPGINNVHGYGIVPGSWRDF